MDGPGRPIQYFLSEAACLLGPLIIGIGSSAFTRTVPCKEKQGLMPPPIVFAIVWPLLYLALGVATLLTWKNARSAGSARSMGTFQLLVCFIAALIGWWLVFANICAPLAAFATLVTIAGLGVATSIVLCSMGDWKLTLSGGFVGVVVAWLCVASYLSWDSMSLRVD